MCVRDVGRVGRLLELVDGSASGGEVDAVHEQNTVFACRQCVGMRPPHGANRGARAVIMLCRELLSCACQGCSPGTFVGEPARGHLGRLFVTTGTQEAEGKKGDEKQALHSEGAIGGLSYEKKAILADLYGDFGRNKANNVGCRKNNE